MNVDAVIKQNEWLPIAFAEYFDRKLFHLFFLSSVFVDSVDRFLAKLQAVSKRELEEMLALKFVHS